MSNLSAYTTRYFKPSQKFLVNDPETGTASLVLGSDLLDYILPNLNSVVSETTRLSAQNTDYSLGTVIQTLGDEAINDNNSALLLVVGEGEGDFVMINGNELLVIHDDGLLRQQLALNTTNNGSDLVAHTGTDDTVTEALDKRTVFVGSVAELEALSLPAGYNVYLAEEGRSGPGIIKEGVPPSDPFKGVYIPTSGGKYWVRQFGQVVSLNGGTVNPLWYGAKGTWDGAVDGGYDDTPHIQAAIDSGFKAVEFLPVSGFYQVRSQVDVLSTSGIETIKGAGGKIKVGNFTSISTGNSFAIFRVTKSNVVVDGIYGDLNGLKNYDDQSGVFYYKWGPNAIRQASGVAIASDGVNTDNVIVKNCHFIDGDSAVAASGNYSGNPKNANTNDNLVTNVKILDNLIEGDRGNAIIAIGGVLGLLIQNNTVLNGFYVSVRVYHSSADVTILKNTVIVNYNNMDPSTFEQSNFTDFSQPANSAIGPRAAGIWYSKGGAGPGDSLGDGVISGNSIRYIGYPTNASVSEKWSAYNLNPKSLDVGSELSLNDNEVFNPIRSGIIIRGVGDGTSTGSKTVATKNTIRNSNRHGIETVLTNSVEVIKNVVSGYDLQLTGGAALRTRDSSDSMFSGNYVSRGLSATTADHLNFTGNTGVTVQDTNYGDEVGFNRYTKNTTESELIPSSTWTPLPGIDLTDKQSLRFRVVVYNTISGENHFAAATFVQDDSVGSGAVIGTVDGDGSGIIDLRVNAGVPEVFLTYISGTGTRRLNFSYFSV